MSRSRTQVESGRVLTPREADVLFLCAKGLTDLQIAHRLYLSHTTVKNVISRVRTRLGVANRVHAVTLMFTSGQWTPADFEESA